jgi:DNA-damage-inducible protein J
MSKTETIRARVEPELKVEAEGILDTLGLSASQAITLFYKQVTLVGGLPFPLRVPNAETRKAMKQARARGGLKSWSDVERLRSAHR